MLFFRSEEHVDRWTRQWKQPRGATFSLQRQFQLSKLWYRDRLRRVVRHSTEEAQGIMKELGFTSSFWSYT